MKKRTFAVVLAVLMALGSFVGIAYADKDYSETYTYTWCTPGVNEGINYTDGDEYSLFFTSQFNIVWDKVDVTFDNAAERERIWINSGDMPDLINEWSFNISEAKSYAEQGLIGKLPDDWKERWPNLAAAYARTGISDLLDEELGGTYVLPHPIFAEHQPVNPLVWHYVAFMRKDWVEAVGYELKDSYTINELIELATLIKEQDPGQCGADLKVINAHVGYMAYLIPYAMYENSWPNGIFFKDSDGVIKWGPSQPEMLEALKVYQQMYKDGLINPEFYTLNANEGQEDFYTTGNTAICVECGMAVYMQRYEGYFEGNLGLNYDDVVHTAVITGTDGKYHSAELANYSGGTLFSPDLVADTPRFERLMDLLDYTCTAEAQRVLRLGIEGKDWRFGENDEIEVLVPNARSQYPSANRAWSNIYVLSDDFGIINPSYPQKFRDRVMELYLLKAELSDETTVIPANWDIRFYTSPAMDKVTFNYPEEYAKLILKEGDLETNWNNWVKESMLYVQPVLDELNALYGG